MVLGKDPRKDLEVPGMGPGALRRHWDLDRLDRWAKVN